MNPPPRRRLALLTAAAAAAAAAAVATAAALPPFSWSRVALYNELCSVNGTAAAELSPALLAYLASGAFSLVVVEHAQGQGAYIYNGSGPFGPDPYAPPAGLFFEDHAALAASQLKAVNQAVAVLYYQNSDQTLPYYRAAQEAAAYDVIAGCEEDGDHMCPDVRTRCWNQSSARTRAHWLASFAATLAAAPALDGVYVDTGGRDRDPAQHAGALETLAALQAAFPSKLVGFHVDPPEAPEGLGLVQTYTFAAPGAGRAALAWLLANGAAGRVALAHAQTTLHTGAFNYSLAFFAFSSKKPGPDNAIDFCSRGPGDAAPDFPTWCSGQGWAPEYERPLGAPDGDAAPTGGARGETRRSFGGGATVAVAELDGAACRITWADGATTECAG